jgi:hypothetical protein
MRRALANELLAQRRFGKRREVRQQLDSVKTAEEAIEGDWRLASCWS